MASNITSSELWYCHSCQGHVVPNLEEFCCSVCQSGCIEQTGNSEQEGRNNSQTTATDQRSFNPPPPYNPPSPLNPFSLLQGIFNPMAGVSGAHVGFHGGASVNSANSGPNITTTSSPNFNFFTSTSAQSSQNSSETPPMFQFGQSRPQAPPNQFQFGQFNPQTQPNPFNLLQGLFNPMPGFNQGATGGGGSGAPQGSNNEDLNNAMTDLNALHLNSFNRFFTDLLTGLMGNAGEGVVNIQLQPMMVPGNIGDYVFTQGGLDNVVTMLMNQVDGSGPPPADSQTISSLPSLKILQKHVDDHTQCHVCMEDFSLDEEVKCLPCKHLYHNDCIVPWLEMRGTCPICRQRVGSPPSFAPGFVRGDAAFAPSTTSATPSAPAATTPANNFPPPSTSSNQSASNNQSTSSLSTSSSSSSSSSSQPKDSNS